METSESNFISFYEIIEEKLLKNSHFQGLVLLRFPSSSLQSFLDENRSSMESQSTTKLETSRPRKRREEDSSREPRIQFIMT